jgi:hypothetical protein
MRGARRPGTLRRGSRDRRCFGGRLASDARDAAAAGFLPPNFRMNPRCSECGAVFWVDEGEWLGAFVIDWAFATGTAIVVWMALELTFARLPQTVEIATISACVVVSLFATFPWSRSFWTAFLYLTGAMGERPALAQDTGSAAPPAVEAPSLPKARKPLA